MTSSPERDRDDTQADDEGGSVSEVANLGDGEPISPDQSVAAAPGDESDGVQEGRQGPNAVTGDESQKGNMFGAAAEERGHEDPNEAGHEE